MLTLTTQRLILRPFRDGDEYDCLAFLSHRETCWLDGGYEPFPVMDEKFYDLMDRFRADGDHRLMLQLKGQDRVIGVVHIMKDDRRMVKAAELGFVLAPAYRRQGYAFESVSEVIRHLFANTDTQMVTATAIPQNTASQALLRKLGFTREGTTHKGFFYPPEGFVDLDSFYMDKP